MCGRIALYSPPDRIARILDARLSLGEEEWKPSWNVAPTDPILGVREDPDGARSLRSYRWGLVPMSAKDPAAFKSSFNARAESIATKPAFRWAFEHSRILVPVDAFYEWRKEGKSRTPHLFRRADGQPTVFAGLSERWKRPDGSIMYSATVVTTGAGGDMDQIHDRMPVVLEPDAWDVWLDPGARNRDELEVLLRPGRTGTLVHHEVSRAVGNVRNNGPELILAVSSLS
ncbi:MAG: SOS response-associated peptidase [Acidimicrobiales bacterium]